MKPNFTPGPWRLEGNSIVTDYTCIAVIEDDGGYEAPGEQREANKHLISAAIEMFESCEGALMALRSGKSLSNEDRQTVITHLRNSIRKAKGEASTPESPKENQ